MEKLKTLKKVYSGIAVCMIILGIILVLRPSTAIEIFIRICGILLILFGVARLFGYFSRDLLQLAFQFDFAMGIISCLLGFLMIFWPLQLLDILMTGIGVYMLADALLRIQTAMDARRIGMEKWWTILIVSLLTAVIGTLLFLMPHYSTEVFMILIGLNLIVDGILNLYVVQSTVDILTVRDN